MKSVVTISRHWNNPKILTKIDKDLISLSIEFDDFMLALKKEINLDEFVSAIKEEIGSVTWTFRSSTFEKQFNAAVEAAFKSADPDKKIDEAVKLVLKRIKEESSKVV